MKDQRTIDLLKASLKETREALECLVEIGEPGEVLNAYCLRVSNYTPLTYRVVMNLKSQGLVETSTYIEVDCGHPSSIQHLRVTDVWATKEGIEYAKGLK
jgi:hypothetical protein